MKRVQIRVVIGAALAVCLPVLCGADDGDLTQYGMNKTAAAEYGKADAALNAVYRKLLATKADDPIGKAKLVAAERLWIQFRDADAESVADDNRGGSIVPMVRFAVLKDLTEARTADLKARLEYPAGR